MKKETKEFVKFLKENIHSGEKSWLWHKHKKTECDKVVDYFSALKRKDIVSIVSDDYWNNYPRYRSCPDDVSRGLIIGYSIELIRLSHPKIFDLIIKHGKGLFLIFAMNNAKGSIKLAAAKRAAKSKDYRARLRAVKILPVNNLKSFKTDKTSSVRTAYIRRVGIENCYRDFLNDKSSRIRLLALSHASIEEFDYQEFIDNWKKEYGINSDLSWSSRQVLFSIISQMSKEQIIFNLDMCNINGSIGMGLEKILQDRLEISW